MRRERWLVGVLSIALVAGTSVFASARNADAQNPPECGQRSVDVRNDDPRCVVQFASAGEPWDPGGGSGGVTEDRNHPPVISIRSGTTVEFQNFGMPHVVAVYDRGLNKNGTTNNLTTFRDIVYVPGAPPSVINDPVGRLAMGASGTSLEYTFEEPGQYLVICAFRPHFENYGQSTYVIVDETLVAPTP